MLLYSHKNGGKDMVKLRANLKLADTVIFGREKMETKTKTTEVSLPVKEIEAE